MKEERGERRREREVRVVVVSSLSSPSSHFRYRLDAMDGLIDIQFTQSFIDYAKRSSSTLPESDLFSIKCQFTHLLA